MMKLLLDAGWGDDILVAGLTVFVLVLRVAIGVVGGAVVIVTITGVCTSAKIHFSQLLFFSQQPHLILMVLC